MDKALLYQTVKLSLKKPQKCPQSITIFRYAFLSSGKQIENDPAIDRLIEIRTVLEKIRPIDYKLRYQIDKLVKTAITGTSSASDPNSFKPNPSNLISKLGEEAAANDDESDSDDSDDEPKAATSSSQKKRSSKESSGGGSGVYVPPKLSAVHYDEGDSKAERSRKQLERAKKRALRLVIFVF